MKLFWASNDYLPKVGNTMDYIQVRIVSYSERIVADVSRRKAWTKSLN